MSRRSTSRSRASASGRQKRPLKPFLPVTAPTRSRSIQTSTCGFGFMDRRERGDEKSRRRRTAPALTSLVGRCALGAAVIVWLQLPAAPGAVAQTPAAQVQPIPAALAAPLSPVQEKAL